jgi:hypothetical protein
MDMIIITAFLIAIFSEQFLEIVAKVIIPAWIGVSIKIATIMRKEKITWARVVSSYISGIGMAWICGAYVLNKFDPSISTVIIAAIAISSEKITEYLIYKLTFNDVLNFLNKFKK